METIFLLCPSLKRHVDLIEFENALTRMCIAHVLNGGEFVGLYETAIKYLEDLK